MKISDFCQTIDRHLSAETDAEKRLLLLTNALQQAFKVRADEFAVLRLDATHQDLCFLWPKKLSKSGHVPLNARDSLVARTAREVKPHLDNQFTSTRHASIFERISLGDAKAKEVKSPALPIQKIMSVPVQQDGQLCGVMQLSRKGVDADAAGPDFTLAELDAFAAIANAVARYIPW
jgi:transcriptional regulator with GAF, ATPase, and Fis domain